MNKGWPDRVYNQRYYEELSKLSTGTKIGLKELQDYQDKIEWLESRPELPDKTKSDGGPSNYYDFPKGALTLNDLIEFKNMDFHLGNVFKAVWRFGTKDGTSQEYDCRKIIYSGARLLMKYAGVKELRKTLQGMLDDPQFQERTD